MVSRMGVHGISIARRNNWVQSGRLPYVTSAPFKRKSASASSSHPHPCPPSFHSRAAPDSPARRQKDQLGMRKKRAEKGDYRAKCMRTRTGWRRRAGKGEDGKGVERNGRGKRRGGSRRKEEHAVKTGARDQGAADIKSAKISVTKKEEGRNRGKDVEEAAEEEHRRMISLYAKGGGG